MKYVLIAFLVLIVMTALIKVMLKTIKENPTPTKLPFSTCNTCAVRGDKCEQDCMMEASTKKIEYYDDRHLDDFRGRPSDKYTDEEAEIFSTVLYRLRQDEVAGWNRSLVLRGINIPNQIKDEVIMMITEKE
jgi:hypothetical protein